MSEPQPSFRDLYERHSGPLFRFLIRFTENPEAAEELLHDIFVELLRGSYRPEPGSSVQSWLYTVARNRGLNYRRRPLGEPLEALPSEPEAPWKEQPETRAIDRDLGARLRALEPSLPEELRETWQLRKQGLDYAQIASRLAVPVGTVKSRFFRLVRLLQEEFVR
jgi:RNA polymerase sigma-70 factor, ECF subfamily